MNLDKFSKRYVILPDGTHNYVKRPADERLYYYESLEYLKMVFIDILSYRKCTVSVDFLPTTFIIDNPFPCGKAVRYSRDFLNDGDLTLNKILNSFKSMPTIASIKFPGCYIWTNELKSLRIDYTESKVYDEDLFEFIKYIKTLDLSMNKVMTPFGVPAEIYNFSFNDWKNLKYGKNYLG